MDAWQLWRAMARESEKAARLAESGSGAIEETPSLLQDQLQTLIRSRDRRTELVDRLIRLYWLRLNADYRGVRSVVAAQVVRAGRDTRFILRVPDGKLPGRH